MYLDVLGDLKNFRKSFSYDVYCLHLWVRLLYIVGVYERLHPGSRRPRIVDQNE